MNRLSPDLSAALHHLLASVSVAELRQASLELSTRYKQGQFIQTRLHRYAYLAARMPATYGVISQVLSQLSPAQKSLCQTFLDLGAGAGSLIWAVADAFPHSPDITLVEQDAELARLGAQLLPFLDSGPSLSWKIQDMTCGSFLPHDVVVLSYALNELSETEQLQIVKQAYAATRQFFILIEPGTPQGFGRLLKFREILLDLGASMVAPCPQGKACPLAPAFQEGKDWCHFSVRVAREGFHQHAKDGKLSYEDEKYMYLIVSPAAAPLPKARILKAPRLRSGHVILDLCEKTSKLMRQVISKKEGALYGKAKAAKWGDVWDAQPTPLRSEPDRAK